MKYKEKTASEIVRMIEQEQVIELPPVVQPAAAPVEKPKVNLYPFLPPGYTSRTD